MSHDYWENRYQTGDMPWEKGMPSPGLVDWLSGHQALPRASVCVPGCGTGHDAAAWAGAGFQVFACDLAPSAVRLTSERLKKMGLHATVERRNFLSDPPAAQFDWLFEHTLFCAIDPKQRDDYVRAVTRWIKPQGQYLAVNYLIPDTEGPPFGTTREELWNRFSASFDLIEEWVPRSYPNRTGLERMLWWRKKVA